MDDAHLEYRKIGHRVLELLAGIDLERPQVDEERAAERLQAYVETQHEPVSPVRFLPDLRVLRESLWPGRVWPDVDRGESGSERHWLLLDERWTGLRDELISKHPFPEVQTLASTDQAVLATGLGDSHHVAGVRWVTTSLNVRGWQLAAGDVRPPHPRWRHLSIPRVRALLPLAEAAAAGLFAFAVGHNGDLVAVSRPRLRLDAEGRLHDWDGLPAAEWLAGRGLYFWRGVEMTESAGRRPELVTSRGIAGWANAERRRVAIERIGLEAFVRGLGAEIVQQDDFGRLWRTRRTIGGEPYAAVEVVNATAEADGRHRRYFLRVPPTARSARAAVAWSFGLLPSLYDPAVET
ncbi:MAG: hypothetical protein M3O95_02675 [Candidatus Dormibacteraeota bacterium]|nr:hypothetical protein [Candidatus Dormibacteraeota bacterium]